MYANPVSREYSALLTMIASCPAHILLMCEAAGLEDEDIAPLLRAHERDWMWKTSKCKSLAVGIRETHGAILRTLCDSTDLCTPHRRYSSDDPCPGKMQDTILWYPIVEVEFRNLTWVAGCF